MRCDTSELLFEQLLDGTIAPRPRAELISHLDRCANCSSVLEELRVVDALLLTPRSLEPPVNFTFKTMAEIRAMPAPAPLRRTWPWLFALYLTLSWVAIGAWLAVGRPDAHGAFALVAESARHTFGALDGIARVAGTGFGLGYAGVAGAVTFLLIADVALLFAVLFVRSVVRPRLAAHLARSEAS